MRSTFMMRAVLVVLMASGATVSRADDRDAIPPGSGWFCYTATNEFNASDRSGGCARTEAQCNEDREGWDSSGSISVVLGECSQQKNAAVYTYFNVMHEGTFFRALPSSGMCSVSRRLSMENPDKRRVSACQIIGDRPYPPGRFAASRVPAGAVWHCVAGERGYHGCSRDLAKCERASREFGARARCVTQSAASALTWQNRVTDLAYTAVTSLGTDGIGVFSSATSCAAFRKQHAAWVSGLAACTSVGAIEGPAPDQSQLPEGDGWSCFSVKKATNWKDDTCSRTTSSCVTLRAQVEDSGAQPTECTDARRAFVFVTPREVFAFRTDVECRRRAAEESDASRCVSVGVVGNGGAERSATSE